MNNWFRLWHDMAYDPKWRTIARVSGSSIPEVVAVAIFLMTEASCNTVARGQVDAHGDRRIAALLDMEISKVSNIRIAMQGRFLDGTRLCDWKKIKSPQVSLRPISSVWRKTRTRIFHRDNHVCQYCHTHADKLECDHVIPVSRGGNHDDENLVTACRRCNRKKKDKMPNQWRPF